jgi:hypothetical protein
MLQAHRRAQRGPGGGECWGASARGWLDADSLPEVLSADGAEPPYLTCSYLSDSSASMA